MDDRPRIGRLVPPELEASNENLAAAQQRYLNNPRFKDEGAYQSRFLDAFGFAIFDDIWRDVAKASRGSLANFRPLKREDVFLINDANIMPASDDAGYFTSSHSIALNGRRSSLSALYHFAKEQDPEMRRVQEEARRISIGKTLLMLAHEVSHGYAFNKIMRDSRGVRVYHNAISTKSYRGDEMIFSQSLNLNEGLAWVCAALTLRRRLARAPFVFEDTVFTLADFERTMPHLFPAAHGAVYWWNAAEDLIVKSAEKFECGRETIERAILLTWMSAEGSRWIGDLCVAVLSEEEAEKTFLASDYPHLKIEKQPGELYEGEFAHRDLISRHLNDHPYEDVWKGWEHFVRKNGLIGPVKNRDPKV